MTASCYIEVYNIEPAHCGKKTQEEKGGGVVYNFAAEKIQEDVYEKQREEKKGFYNEVFVDILFER